MFSIEIQYTQFLINILEILRGQEHRNTDLANIFEADGPYWDRRGKRCSKCGEGDEIFFSLKMLGTVI